MRRLSAFALALCAAGLLSAAPPQVMLWSWFTADDFRFLETPDVGVAYLALSLAFSGRGTVIPAPRLESVLIAPHTWQTAVIRFDFDSYGLRRPAFTDQQRKLAVQMIGEIAQLSHAPGIQIDFDAPPSAYPFYRRLLADVRQRLGPKVFLSITALVSWCDTDSSWLAGLPVDEIVPMAFSMGQATPAIQTMLESGGQFRFPACRASIGVVPPGGYDTAIRPRKSQRAYFFANQPWTAETLRRAEAAIRP